MAKSQALKLSALKQNVDYPVANKLVDKRCLIHVKLTESCLGAIEGLMNSDKVSHCFIYLVVCFITFSRERSFPCGSTELAG